MAINATDPTTLSAAEYPFWAVQQLVINGDGLADFGQSSAAPVAAVATLVKFRVRPDGVHERSPLASDRINLSMPDLYAEASADPTVAAAISALVAAVQSYGTSKGLL